MRRNVIARCTETGRSSPWKGQLRFSSIGVETRIRNRDTRFCNAP
jgi:hypothetical protein